MIFVERRRNVTEHRNVVVVVVDVATAADGLTDGRVDVQRAGPGRAVLG